MGKIKVRGYAEKKVEVDECIYTIRFSNDSAYGEDAIRRVKENTELFLEKLKEQGIDITKIRLEDDYLNGSTKLGQKTCVRKLSMLGDASPKTNNMLLDIIKTNKIEASISTEYQYSKKEELHKELLAEAVKDSRAKAEIIALANGNKVINIDYSTFDRYEYDEDEDRYNMVDGFICERRTPTESITDKLSNKLELESEEIFITWIID